MNQIYLKKSICALFVSGSFANMAYAESMDEKNRLAEIVVYANQNLSLSSAQTITKEEIKNQPAGNGNISDYLKSNPHIRFENSDSNTMQRGEIKPESISINGADVNQTSYFVDNVNVNNDLGFDTLTDGTMATMPLANSAQGYFFDANLLSSINVYDSDVSASLGGFSGGAVVAKTKQYDGTDRIRMSYRTSRSAWAKFNIDDKDLAKFNKAEPNGSAAEYQPKYDKHFFSLSAEQALSAELGVVAGFSRRGSHIQQTRLISPNGETDKRNHTRRSDNALLNFNWIPNSDQRIEWGLRYSNYRESKYFATNIDSDLKDYHDAFGTTLSWVNGLKSGVLTTTLAYDEFQDKRHSASTQMKTIIDDEGNEYTTGGMGNSKLKQRNLHFSTEYAVDPFDLGQTNHSLSIGGIYQFTQYHFQRYQDAYGEIVSLLDFDGDGVAETELPLSENIAKKGKAKAKYQNFALYLEDLMTWKNVDVRFGLRLERDDYLKNNNLAPRFVVRYKPWQDTALSLGLNRYYGRSFAGMKLAEEVFKLDGHDSYRYKDITSFKTPYADELSFGLQQNWGNFAFNAKYILRNNKNRIVLHEGEDENGDSVKYYRKGKNYKANVYTFEVNNIEPWKLGITEWQTKLAFDWLDTKSIDYGLSYDEHSLLILDGKLMTFAEMRKKINNNKENWNVRFGIDMNIPQYNLSWSNNIYIKAPIKGIEELEIDSDPTAYRSYNYGTHTQWDTSIRWQPTIFTKHSPYIKFDILNVLNKTRKGIGKYGDDLGVYSAGREYWLEVGYEF